MEPGTEDEDDYMSMVIAEPTRPDKETSIQRAARKKKEVSFSPRAHVGSQKSVCFLRKRSSPAFRCA
jgi:hypothetical protein